MIIHYTERAIADLAGIAARIARDRPQAAVNVGQRIRQSIARLAECPESGRSGRIAGTRELILSGLPWFVAYRIDGDFIAVLTIRHTARQWRDPT